MDTENSPIMVLQRLFDSVLVMVNHFPEHELNLIYTADDLQRLDDLVKDISSKQEEEGYVLVEDEETVGEISKFLSSIPNPSLFTTHIVKFAEELDEYAHLAALDKYGFNGEETEAESV